MRMWFAVLLGAAVFAGCAGSDGPQEPISKQQQEQEDERRASDFDPFVFSATNNAMTSRRIDTSKAQAIARRLKGKATKGPDRQLLADTIAALRFSKAPLSEVLQWAEKAAAHALKRGIELEVSDRVKLEVVLAAIQAKKFALAAFYLDELVQAKTPRVKAGALNALGIIAALEDRLPEAIAYWKQALDVVSSYEASALNVGFYALRYAHLDTARRMLSKIDDDWFVESGFLVVSRLSGDAQTTSDLCTQLIPRNHKPTLFNCGIHQWQDQGNSKEAKSLIQKAMSMRGGPARWDQDGDAVLLRIQ